uniref:hypothetical protein n=1 Tax=Algoriphagus sp. TaxID=1872435 RepID=UPI004048A41A
MEKKNLLKLLDFIDEISHLHENQWFNDILRSKFENKASSETYLNHEALELVNELKRSKYYLRTIDRKIWKEAIAYYSCIFYTDLKVELIHDYKEMKIAEKSDDIIEFTRRIVMQLENCLNAVCTILKSHDLIKASPEKYQNNNTNLLMGEHSFFNVNGSEKQISKISIQSKIFFAKQYYDIYYSYNDMRDMITIRNKSSHRGEYSEKEKEIIEEAKGNVESKKSSYFVCYDTFWKKMTDLQK